MARQISDTLELENEISDLRETLYAVLSTLKGINSEYFDGAKSLSENAIEEVQDELDTVFLTIENILM